MKIIQVISSLGNGGAEKFVVELSNALSEEHGVLLCTFKPVESWMLFPKLLRPAARLVSLDKKAGFDAGIYKQLYKLFKAEKPDVVHFHLDATIKYIVPLILFFPRIHFIYTIHSNLNTDKINLFNRLSSFKFLTTKIKYVCISEIIYQEFKKKYPAFNFVLITNGISAMKTSPELAKVKEEVSGYKANDKTKVFLTVGNYSEPKNFSLIVDVFAKLHKEKQDAILLIIGNDSDPGQAEWKKIEGLKSTNTFMLGLKNNVQDYLSLADAYCLCSTFEGLPISILEAYAMGKPVLSTPAGGIPSILQNNLNGLLSADFTTEAYYGLVMAFTRLDENKLESIRQNNLRNFMEHYTIEKTSARYILNYKN